jgi:hypothetical protein
MRNKKVWIIIIALLVVGLTKDIKLWIMIDGLIIELIGVYYLGKNLFLQHIWKGSFQTNWSKAPRKLKLWCLMFGINNEDKLRDVIEEMWLSDAGLHKNTQPIYWPFYGFFYVLIGVLMQVIANFMKN